MSFEIIERGFMTLRAEFKTRMSGLATRVVDETYGDGCKAECLRRRGHYGWIGFTNGSDDSELVDILPEKGTIFVRNPHGWVISIMSTEEFANGKISIGDQVVHHSMLGGLDLQRAFHRPTERVLALNKTGSVSYSSPEM